MECFDFFESYTFKLLTETYYYVTYNGYETAHAMTGMDLRTMHEWIQKVDTIEELPESMQAVVRLVEENMDKWEEEESDAEEIMQEFYKSQGEI
ncbi:MAG: hypothetical protein K2J08_05895 [Ruminococcus sp.]|nr:hypothetical protein [Ruminococcus sp.]